MTATRILKIKIHHNISIPETEILVSLINLKINK